VPQYRLLTRQLAGILGDRVPPGLVQVVVVLSLVATVAASLTPTGTPLTAATAESLPYYLTGTVQSVVLATALVVVWLEPSRALLLAAGTTLACAIAPDALVGPSGLWWPAAGVLGLLALVDQVTAARRRALARVLLHDGSSMVTLAPPRPDHRAELMRTGAGRRLLGVVLVLGAVGATGWVWHDHHDAVGFRERAVVEDGTVQSVADDGLSMQVEVGSGTYTAPVAAMSRAAGDRVTLRYDPASGRAETVDDVFDATTGLIPVVTLLLTGGVLLDQVRRRRSRIAALLDEPQPAVVVMAVGAPHAGGALLAPVDDLTYHLATAPSLVPVTGPSADAYLADADARAAWGGEQGPDEDEWDEDEDEGAEDEQPWADDEDDPDADREPARAVSDLSDAELLERARALAGELEDEDEPDDPFRPPTGDPVRATGTPVVLIGLAGDDAPVALGFGPDVLLTTRPLLAPRWRLPRRTPVRERRGTWRTFADARDRALERLGRRTGRWLPWVLLPLVAWGTRATARAGALSFHLVLPAVTLVGLAWALSLFGHPRLVLRSRGLHVRRAFVDELIPWDRVRGAAAEPDALVVRYDDGRPGGDALLLPHTDRLLPLTADGATPAEVAVRLRGRGSGAAWAPPGGTTVRLRRWPSMPLVVAVCWVVTGVLAATL
jgi:hypothetical protein